MLLGQQIFSFTSNLSNHLLSEMGAHVYTEKNLCSLDYLKS